jgi:hypothetical protein
MADRAHDGMGWRLAGHGRRWFARSVLMVGVLLSLTGCRSLARAAFIPPDVAVADTKVRNIGLRGGSLDVTLRVDVWVDSTQVATGTIERVVTIPPRSTTMVEVPVEFLLDALRVVMVRFVSSGTVPYRVTGEFRYVTPFGGITRPFESAGTVRR